MIVRHHPSRHPFVENLWGTSAASTSVWDVGALAADGVDVVHLHFGFEHRSSAEMAWWLDDLDVAGIALVHTVHDVDNPHLTDQTDYRRSVGALVERAGAVSTLTPAAAVDIRRSWHRDAAVLPHPNVVPLAEMTRRRRRDRHGVYVHVASGRPNVDLAVLDRLGRARRRPSLLIHARPTAPAGLLAELHRLVSWGRVELEVRPRLGDRELWDRLGSAELLFLPYRWGTHSGLLEAAHDLGTPVLAPAFGGYGDQGAHTFDDDPVAAIDDAVAGRPNVDASRRREARRTSRAAYELLYRQATAAR